MASASSSKETPITGICIVSDKMNVPPGYQPILHAYDDSGSYADIWKERGFLAKAVVRFVCVSRSYAPGTFVYNVVADIALVNEKSQVAPGFVPLDFTEDTREKALRKKILCVRNVPRDTAVDCVSDVIVLARQKKPPSGYTSAGEIDGTLLCFKYSSIPKDLMPTQLSSNAPGVYPNLPYPLHPWPQASSSSAIASMTSAPVRTALQMQPVPGLAEGVNGMSVYEVSRQVSSQCSARSALDGIPFELNSRLKANLNGDGSDLPVLPTLTLHHTENELSYAFSLERIVLSNA